MSKETLEELREKLLRQHNVQQMIQMRAYEIYQMRGGQPGGEAHDWFHAESEVLAFLLADESRADDKPGTAAAEVMPPSEDQAEAPISKKPESRARTKRDETKPAAKKTASKRSTTKTSVESKPKSPRARRKPKGDVI